MKLLLQALATAALLARVAMPSPIEDMDSFYGGLGGEVYSLEQAACDAELEQSVSANFTEKEVGFEVTASGLSSKMYDDGSVEPLQPIESVQPLQLEAGEYITFMESKFSSAGGFPCVVAIQIATSLDRVISITADNLGATTNELYQLGGADNSSGKELGSVQPTCLCF